MIRTIYGPPGTGKTTRAIAIVSDYIGAQGGQPSDIAMVTFSNAAANHARDRVSSELPSVTRQGLRWFCTIHAMAYRLLTGSGMRLNLLDRKAMAEFADRYEYSLRGGAAYDDEAGVVVSQGGDDLPLLEAVHRSRSRVIPLSQAIEQERLAHEMHSGERIAYERFESFANRYKYFKLEKNMIDFSDLIDMSLEKGLVPEVSLAIIDEAQDLNPQQVRAVETWFADSGEVYYIGDDDQSINGFTGIDPEWFRGLGVRHRNKTILDQSYRVPQVPHGYAQEVIGRVRHRQKKTYKSVEHTGRVDRGTKNRSGKYVKQYLKANPAATCYVLVRNYSFVRRHESILQAQGVPYEVETSSGTVGPLSNKKRMTAVLGALKMGRGEEVDHEQLIGIIEHVKTKKDVMPRGMKKKIREFDEFMVGYSTQTLRDQWSLNALADAIEADPINTLDKIPERSRKYMIDIMFLSGDETSMPAPRCKIMTIHKSKGREADLIVIDSDMSSASYNELLKGNRDEEHRVAYVALTRSRDSVYICYPDTKKFYVYPSTGRMSQ